MENLKSLLPPDLNRAISQSTPDDLVSTCSSLLHFLLPSPPFQRVVRELTDPEMGLFRKSREAALDLKRKGNACFCAGEFAEALDFYSQALRFAPMISDDMDKDLVATLFVNRASSMHKLDLLEECKRDCCRAVALSPCYVKAWYRRGKANILLKNYEEAIHDLEVALSMESSLPRKKYIKEDLEMAISNFKRTSDTRNSPIHDFLPDYKSSDMTIGPSQVELHCVSTQGKGKGMVSLNSIPPSFLVHCEEPLAVIILKHCRETHCHFCFNELPADVIFCSSCTIPLYCSQQCQAQMKAEQSEGTKKQVPEHRHECGGINWAAVLPPDVVLVGRVMANFIEKQKHFGDITKPMEVLDFVHHYARMPSESRLESHIYSLVLSYCLHKYFGSDFSFTGASAAQLVILMSQIKVNSMAVVHMNSQNQAKKLSVIGGALTCNIEQVRVGQAIYSTGRLFNHSCQPNIHAYFLSRKLFLRSTEFVPAGYPLEFSYGPQVGQWCLHDRQESLEDQYFFKCQCRGCSELNMSDIVINAFRCVKPNCSGAVLTSCMACQDKAEDNSLHVPTAVCSLELPHPVSEKKDAINKVAHLLLETPKAVLHTSPGCCLNCGSYLDLKASSLAAKTAMTHIERFKDAMISKDDPTLVFTDGLKALNQLKLIRHAYSKDVAQAEDTMAAAFCLMGEFESALQYCKASIEILEKLYSNSHIVIGNELVKLASLQLCLDDRVSAKISINRLEAIFSRYYGSHAAQVFPYLESLGIEAKRLAP